MAKKPYVLCSLAMSLDACIDDTTSARLVLSNKEDLRCIDALRAEHDAILVGANTLRRDNPGLCVHSEDLRSLRSSEGRSPDPLKVTILGAGSLEASLKFFHEGACERLVYCAEDRAREVARSLGTLAAVVACRDERVDPAFLLEDLHNRGVRRLMIEGGALTHELFLRNDLVDEFRIAIAPLFVRDAKAPRFTGPEGRMRLRLDGIENIAGMAVLTYRREVPGTAGVV